jgi:hypothetical protein
MLHLRLAVILKVLNNLGKRCTSLFLALVAVALPSAAVSLDSLAGHPFICLAVQSKYEELPRSIVYPIAHIGMSADLEIKLRAVIDRFADSPEMIFETRPTDPLKKLPCTGSLLATPEQELRREVVDLLGTSENFLQLGVHPGLIAGLPASVIYFLATAQCTGQISQSPPISTEVRIFNELKLSMNQVDFLENGEELACLIHDVPSRMLLDAAKSQIESCREHDSAVEEIFHSMRKGGENDSMREIYTSRLRKIGHNFLDLDGFIQRDKKLQQRIGHTSSLIGKPRFIFAGAFHLPIWLTDGGTSPDGLNVSNICR